MPGPEKERDWDKEMAEVDRLLKRLPGADPTLGRGAEPTVRRPAVSGGVITVPGGRAPGGGRLGTWVRVVLGVLIGVGVTPGVWPYTHGCGLRLIFYLLGLTTLIATGVWTSLSSWKRRLGFAHVISQILIIWGILLAAGEVLPRMRGDAAAVLLCPDVTPPRR
ncbi:MAG TPA: hypothetical protein VM716_07510 [Gemmatimonadales bacterium]|nr:hypothetical protein [Gemmatimonadales bacterium]